MLKKNENKSKTASHLRKTLKINLRLPATYKLWKHS